MEKHKVLKDRKSHHYKDVSSLRMIYTANATAIKITTGVLKELDKLLLKNMLKSTSARMLQNEKKMR